MSSYTVSSTERLTAHASNAETKALLYLMNFRSDSDEICFFIVDFFNDVTGMDRHSTKLWDVQSKSSNNVHPKQIGKNLVTLFKNFLSEFNFDSYILFMGKPVDSVRIDGTKTVFGVENITATALAKLTLGLKEEALRVTYIDNEKISEKKLEEFLKRIYFVVDNKEPCDYIKPMIKVKPELIPSNEILTGIFNEIRDLQSSQKNGPSIEGITINIPEEALNYSRHLEAESIKLLVLSRVINRNPMEQNPISFGPILNSVPQQKKKDCLENCRIDFCRALFDKNNINSFWSIFEEIILLIKKNPSDDVNQIYSKMSKRILAQDTAFDAISLKFFIANIKDGIEL